MELVVFSGIQGSGKSTFFQHRFATTHIRISLDVVRTRQREDVLLFACLSIGQSVVVDNTSPTQEQRHRYAQLAKSAGMTPILYYFDTHIDDALRRNNARPETWRVPEIGVRGTFAKLQYPTPAEEFERIYIVKNLDNSEWNVEQIK